MNNINSKRALPIKGGYNFRDLGGIITQDSKTLKRNLLIRSDELNGLEDADLKLLTQLNVQTIVDFRTAQERAQSVDRIPSSCKNEFHLNILSANMDTLMAEFKSGKADFKQMMIDIYQDLVLSDNAHIEYSKFFEIIQDPKNTSIIYHCTAGKDRTGIATALILEALNVEWQSIENDYMLSNFYLKDKYATYINLNPAMADLLLVQPMYLESAFSAIKKEYSSVKNYLTSVLKVDLDLMKSIYTE